MPQVYLEKENKTITAKNLIIKDILTELNINPTIVLVVHNDELITEDFKLKKDDKIEILTVISGG